MAVQAAMQSSASGDSKDGTSAAPAPDRKRVVLSLLDTALDGVDWAYESLSEPGRFIPLDVAAQHALERAYRRSSHAGAKAISGRARR
jgi:hypothetical protein